MKPIAIGQTGAVDALTNDTTGNGRKHKEQQELPTKLPKAGMRLPRNDRKYRKVRYGKRDAWKKMPARFWPWSAKERRFVDEAETEAAADERVVVTPSMMPSALAPPAERTDEVVSMASTREVGSTARLETTDVRDATEGMEDAIWDEGANATALLAMARVVATAFRGRWELIVAEI